MNTECSVCIDQYNKTTHAPITCNFCSFKACKACCIKFIADAHTDPACMNCKKTWSNDFMASSFGKTFVNTKLKVLREDMLFEREKGLMPATQAYVEWLINDREITHKLRTLKEKGRKLKMKLYYESGITDTERVRIFEQMNDNRWEIEKLNLKRRGSQHNEVKTVDKQQYVRQCPSSECKGFRNTQWKCGLCGLQACPKCHEVKNELESEVNQF